MFHNLPLRRKVFHAWRRVADWVYPAGCVICGRECRAALPLCGVCRRRLPVFDHPLCPVCGTFVRDGQPTAVCAAHMTGGLSLVWFAGQFDDGYRPLIHALKYERQLALGEYFGRRIGRMMRRSVASAPAVPLVIPVPLHRTRQKERGYNQSATIASGLARVTGFPLAQDPLLRVRKTRDQTKLSPAERIANVRGAFRIAQPGSFTDKNVILVDDVMTTGATLAECARVLFSDGAPMVQAVVIAVARPPGVGQ